MKTSILALALALCLGVAAQAGFVSQSTTINGGLLYTGQIQNATLSNGVDMVSASGSETLYLYQINYLGTGEGSFEVHVAPSNIMGSGLIEGLGLPLLSLTGSTVTGASTTTDPTVVGGTSLAASGPQGLSGILWIKSLLPPGGLVTVTTAIDSGSFEDSQNVIGPAPVPVPPAALLALVGLPFARLLRRKS